MAEMPAPITRPPIPSRANPRCAPLESLMATPEVTIAIARDKSVVGTSYRRGIGNEKASMPMKCMDQMPIPIANAPPRSHHRLTERSAAATWAASFNAV